MTVLGGNKTMVSDVNTLETVVNAELQYGSERPMTLLRQATTGQTVNDNTTTVLAFNTTAVEVYDDLGWHLGTLNDSRITPTVAGRYHIKAHVVWAASTTVTSSTVNLTKNGTVMVSSGNVKPNATDALATFGGAVEWYADANGTTDYFEVSVSQQSTGNVSQTTNITSSGYTWFLVQLHRET